MLVERLTDEEAEPRVVKERSIEKRGQKWEQSQKRPAQKKDKLN